jgi:hypothetical protein
MSREEAFGGYQIVEQIGHGAAGTVFVAEHGPLRHQVAIKVLHPHLIGDGWEQRMFAEADVLSRIDHPGIVKVFDMGLADDGRAYVVMELLAGESLHERLLRARLTEDRAVAFARQLASALEAAHRAGVVHRDLKPENVFVVRDPELPGGERTKLLDFGIAKRKGTEQTATGVVLGTPAYMAPEQHLGSRHVDPRADIYSLGVLLYEMATGTRPFSGRDTGELLAEHAYCMPPPASEVGGVSLGLSAIIERCLAKHPDDRFATMGELGAALRALDAPAAAASPLAEVSPLAEGSTLVFATLGGATADPMAEVTGNATTDVIAGLTADAATDVIAGLTADATTDAVLRPRLFGDDPIAYLAPPSAPVRALTPPPVRRARRTVRGLLVLLAAAAAAALALGYGLDPDVAVADTAGAPTPDMAAALAADPAGTPAPDMAAAPDPIELPAVEARVPAAPVSPAELATAEVGRRGARSVEAMRRDMPPLSAGRAGARRAGAPARAPRPRAMKNIDSSRKPAKEGSYATVSPPTLY